MLRWEYSTRRIHNQSRSTTKPVWKCRIATNKGIENCPNSKAIDEIIIKETFLEAMGLLADNFEDVLESVLKVVEDAISTNQSEVRIKQVEKIIASLEKKRNKLTDIMLNDIKNCSFEENDIENALCKEEYCVCGDGVLIVQG